MRSICTYIVSGLMLLCCAAAHAYVLCIQKNDSYCRVPDAIKFASTCSVFATSAAAFVVEPPVTNVSAIAAASWSVLVHHSCSIFVLAATIA
jgi:hypothetical protein